MKLCAPKPARTQSLKPLALIGRTKNHDKTFRTDNSNFFFGFLLPDRRPKNIVGNWTLVSKIKDGQELRKNDDDRIQLEFLANGEMKHLVNGGRAGIGFYSYKIIMDSIYRTGIQINSLGKSDSTFIGSNKFSIRLDTLAIVTDAGILRYKKDDK